MNIFEWSMNYSFNAYYEDCCKILNIEKYHNEATLKDAYHKKVLESHPDKGGKTEDFIKVNEAYKFLKSLIMDNPKTSKCKDTFSYNKSHNIFSENNKCNKNRKKISIQQKGEDSNKNQNKNEKDINTFNNQNMNKPKNTIKPKNVSYRLEIELSDAYFGSRKIVKLNRNRICKKCSEQNQLNVSNPNLQCDESQLKEVQLIIKPGTYNGCKVIFKGEGEQYIGYEPGDIIFEIIVKENKNYLNIKFRMRFFHNFCYFRTYTIVI